MRVWVQIIGLLAMLVFGIFIGMDVAERNMQKMQGIEGCARAIQITPQEGKIEISRLRTNHRIRRSVGESRFKESGKKRWSGNEGRNQLSG